VKVNDPLEAKQRVNAALEGKGKLPSKRSDGVAGSYPDEFKMKLAFRDVIDISLPGYANPASEDDSTKDNVSYLCLQLQLSCPLILANNHKSFLSIHTGGAVETGNSADERTRTAAEISEEEEVQFSQEEDHQGGIKPKNTQDLEEAEGKGLFHQTCGSTIMNVSFNSRTKQARRAPAMALNRSPLPRHRKRSNCL
jgi:hypothetical protein